jgi:hypothetical protein
MLPLKMLRECCPLSTALEQLASAARAEMERREVGAKARSLGREE